MPAPVEVDSEIPEPELPIDHDGGQDGLRGLGLGGLGIGVDLPLHLGSAGSLRSRSGHLTPNALKGRGGFGT